MAIASGYDQLEDLRALGPVRVLAKVCLPSRREPAVRALVRAYPGCRKHARFGSI